MINALERDSQMLKLVHGALFFGVPNQGMQTEAFCSIVKNQPNESLVDHLKKDSDPLTTQTKQFDNIISSLNLDIIYFFEEKTSPQLALVSYSVFCITAPFHLVHQRGQIVGYFCFPSLRPQFALHITIGLS
jgi:hypothetical protein